MSCNIIRATDKSHRKNRLRLFCDTVHLLSASKIWFETYNSIRFESILVKLKLGLSHCTNQYSYYTIQLSVTRSIHISHRLFSSSGVDRQTHTPYHSERFPSCCSRHFVFGSFHTLLYTQSVEIHSLNYIKINKISSAFLTSCRLCFECCSLRSALIHSIRNNNCMHWQSSRNGKCRWEWAKWNV